ncbi:MAG: hypothetical protein ACTSYD_00145 [Candidatus Heimdallarchaeaceae archaeon]
MIHAIYIINRAGIPLYYKETLDNASDITRATLFSGVISAIQSLLKDMEIGEATEVSTKAYDILLEVAADFAVVLVLNPCNDEDKKKLRKELAKLTTKVSFGFKNITESNLTKKEEELLNDLTNDFMVKCEKILSASEATKRLRESLW